MSLVFYLEELVSSVHSLMFELEENPAPTNTLDGIIERVSKITEMDYYKGGLSHFFHKKINDFTYWVSTTDSILTQKINSKQIMTPPIPRWDDGYP